jgi:hypothetical protein
MFANKESNMFTKGLSNRVKRLQNDIATETAAIFAACAKLFVTLNIGLDIIAIASSRSFFDANLFCALLRLTHKK